MLDYLSTYNNNKINPSHKMLNWIFCCSEKPNNAKDNNQRQQHKTPLTANINIIVKYLKNSIYDIRIPALNQMRVMFIKGLSREEEFSEPSRVMSAMRRSNNGIRQFKIKVLEEQEEQKKGIDCKTYEHYKQMDDILKDIKKLASVSDDYQISLYFDAEVQEFKKQILQDVLAQFRSLATVPKTKFEIFITEGSQQRIKQIVKVCESVRNDVLMDTERFFKKNQGYKTIAQSNPSFTNN